MPGPPSPAVAPEVLNESLLMLVRAFGADSVHVEIDEAVARAGEQLASRCAHFAGQPLAHPQDVARELLYLSRIIKTRNVYLERSSRLDRLGARAAPPPDPDPDPAAGPAEVPAAATPAPGPPPVAEEVHAILCGRGDAGLEALRRAPAWLASVHRGRLEIAAAELAQLGDRPGKFRAHNADTPADQTFHQPHDLWLWKCQAALVVRDDALANLARLGGNSEAVVAAQARAVAAAIAAAGGAAKVAKGFTDASIVTRAYLQAHPEFGDLSALEAAHAGLVARLAELGLAPDAAAAEPPGLARSAADELAAVRPRIGDLRAKIHAETVAGVEGVVAAASAGDEPARAMLESLARKVPEAWQPGFADSLSLARAERTDSGVTIVDMLIDAAGRGVGP